MNTPAWHAKVPLLIERGMTVPQIAHDLGVSKGAVKGVCYRNGWVPVKCPRGGRPRRVPTRYANPMADFDEGA